MDFTCNGAKNQCPCDNATWDKNVFTETIQTKFGIYCSNSWLMHFSNSISYLGCLVGCLFFGFLSDKIGRLNTLCLALITIAISGCLVALMPNIYLFIVMRFFEGAGAGGGLVCGFVLCIEFCSAEYREIITALYHIPFNIGHLTIAGISYLLRHMDLFQLALSLPCMFLPLIKFIMMESPKWLMDNDHIDGLVKGLKRICPQNCETMEEEVIAFKEARNKAGAHEVKFLEIFKHKGLTLNFVCMAVNYFVCGMGYYGVSQFIGMLGGDIHLNVAISALMTLPGTIACVFLLPIFSRRNFLIVTNICAGVFMLAVVCTPERMNWLKVAFACVSNCFFFMSFIIIFLYGVELFPTSIRNSVLGVLSVLSRIGQILVPPINSLSQTAAGAIFGVMAIIGALLCIPLPETKNSELPSTLEDTKVINQKRLSQLSNIVSPKPGGSQKATT
ncbi:sugar transporter domain-containing protein [Phthorimaea operculella]|nr:sugar transporter domain-containing protein [Phthorimaea operculella]